ncbi:MAG: 6-phosphofructokinase [Clostridia bacterium]|nr:6-phosphofructokinase [Clostridia bacterium]
MKTIAVLTSGGDAPGMNAAIRAVVRAGISMGMNVKGIRRGYAGLIEGDIIDMDARSVSDIIHRGGTILYTARCPEFKTQEGIDKAIATCKKHGIEGIVVIGGDGSFRGARDLSLGGIPCVGVPGTIDNDISSTEYTIGYDTAMNTAMELADKLRDTAQSHERCSVVEVMGRKAGYLALQTGIACGAISILVPEVKFDLEKDVIEKIKAVHKTGKKHFVVVVAEGVGGVEEIAAKIEEETGIESRATILGHVQRGGIPTVRDRVMASQFGYHAVELLNQGIGNRVVTFVGNEVSDKDIYEALAMKKEFSLDRYNIATAISI